MSALARLKQQASQLNPLLSTKESCDKLQNETSNLFLLEDLLKFWLGNGRGNVKDTRSTLLAILATLQSNKLQEQPSDVVVTKKLVEGIIVSIAPISPPKQQEEDEQDGDSETEDDPYKRIKDRCLKTTEIGLGVVSWLFERFPLNTASDGELSTDPTMTLIALSQEGNPWTTGSAGSLARQILQGASDKVKEEQWIVETVMKEYLRPLFSKSKLTSVTPSGRKAEFRENEEAELGLSVESRETKPWKYEDLRSITVLSWALNQAKEDLIRHNWPLFIPPLLTLVEDPATRVRSEGLKMANVFLTKLPAQVARTTGLVTVFEEAIFPSLNYLPSLTPENESVQLLKPAFDALLTLCPMIAEPGTTGWQKLPDKIFRQGIMTAFFHAREYPRIVELLLRNTKLLVDHMQVYAVKHLKDLIATFSSVITDPFALSHVPMVHAALQTLRTTVQCCQPRIIGHDVWQDEIIKMLVVCWVRLLDEGEGSAGKGSKKNGSTYDREDLKLELSMAVKELFDYAKVKDIDLLGKVGPLVKKEPGLADLFHATGI